MKRFILPDKTSCPIQGSIEIDVPFFDVDAMHVAWHGHYVKYLELARCEVLKNAGFGYADFMDSGYLWPIVDMQLRYLKPALFDQKIIVTACLVEWTHRFRFRYQITDKLSGERLLRAETTQVAINAVERDLLLETPSEILRRLNLHNTAEPPR